MSKFRSPVCPYCGKKVNPLISWFLKKEGEYQCDKCGNISNVTLDPTVPFFAFTAIFLSLLIFFIYRFIINDLNVMGIILMTIPFFIFFILALFLIRLRKPNYQKVVRTPNERPAPNQQVPVNEPSHRRPPVSHQTENFRVPPRKL